MNAARDHTGPWADALLAASLFATDTAGLGGVSLRARAGPVREQWLAMLRELLPDGMPLRRVPLHATTGRLLGGLDLAATLGAGRPMAERGLLAEAHGGVLLLTSAERVSRSTSAHLSAVLDTGEVRLERDGIARRLPARVGVVALDEGLDDEGPHEALTDRLAFRLDLEEVSFREAQAAPRPFAARDVLAAMERLPRVMASEAIAQALCAAALALGVWSMRGSMLALRVACTAAALSGREAVADDDAALAARLVLAPRATRLPADEAASGEGSEDADEPGDDDTATDASCEASSDGRDAGNDPLSERVLDATRAALPADLLAGLAGAGERGRATATGKAGAVQVSRLRGRPAGVRSGEPRDGARMNVVETLRAAAPWQRLRRGGTDAHDRPARVEVRREDFRLTRFKHRSETTSVFVVDASGSSAMHRLAEAKGAVEMLLADCYVRRDRVALVAFRGRNAELELPPTRSLTRAKRSLARLPGGGGNSSSASRPRKATSATRSRRT